MKTKFFMSIILLALGIATSAQTSKESANTIIINGFANRLDNYNIYVHHTALAANDSVWLEDGTYIINPFGSAWCYFIDEMPTAGWGHPCKYCFIDTNSNRNVVFDKDIYPVNYSDFESVSMVNRETTPPPLQAVSNNLILADQAEPDKNQWAVLICGNAINDYEQWGNLSCIYTALVNEYGFIEDQGELLYFNHIIVLAPNGVCQIGRDLNNSGGESANDFYASFYLSPDGPNEYSKDLIKTVFDNLSGRDVSLYENGYRALNQSDKLFVYMTGNAGRANENTYLEIENNNNYTDVRLYDYELAEWTKDIECSQMTFLVQSSYSGGFIDDLSNVSDVKCKNRVIQTSNTSEHVSMGEHYITRVDPLHWDNGIRVSEFTYYWSAAMLDYYPLFRTANGSQAGPWCNFEFNEIGSYFPWNQYFNETETLNHIPYDISPSANDNVVSLDEAFIFARNLDTWDQMGYYNPFNPPYEQEATEIPQCAYESSFTQNYMTLSGYKGTNTYPSISTLNNTLYHLAGDITICQGSSLTINDKTVIDGNFMNINNNGTITTAINNTESHINNTTLHNNGTQISLSNCHLRNCNKIYVTSGIVDFSNSTFTNTPLELGSIGRNTISSISIVDNEFNNQNIASNAIYIINCNNLTISDNNIVSSATGISLNNCIGTLSIFNTSSNNNVIVKDNEIHGCVGNGIEVYNSVAKIERNNIYDNRNGISSIHLSTISVMGNSGAAFPSQTQRIRNNRNYQLYTSENSFPKKLQYNIISNNINDNYLIYSVGNTENNMTLNVENNNWSPLAENQIGNFLYTEGGYSYDYLPVWTPGMIQDTLVPIPPVTMLADSDSLIGVGQYSDAYNVLTDIVDYYPNTNEAIIALKSMLHLRYYTDNDYNSLKNYYRTNSVILANSNLAVLGDKLANKCDEILQNYDDAIEWYENVIEDENASYEDKVFATVDLGNLYLIIGEEGNKSTGTLAHLIPKSAEQHAKTTAYLLSTLPGDIINKNQDDMMKDLVQNCVVTTIDNNIKIYLKEGNADITFYNTLGVAVKQSALNEGENIINAEDLKAGVYIWKTSSNNIVNSGKFIKK